MYTASTVFYTLSLHDALPIFDRVPDEPRPLLGVEGHVRPEQYPLGPEECQPAFHRVVRAEEGGVAVEHLEVLRSEEHTSELQSLTNLVCRLLLEKKKTDRREY